MTRIHVRGTLRRVGRSLVLLIPAKEAHRARLMPGQTVHAEIETEPRPTLGLLKDTPYEEYKRSREGGDRDRL
jgi:hypothetical protein